MKKYLLILLVFNFVSCSSSIFGRKEAHFYQQNYDKVWNSLEEYFVQNDGTLDVYDKSKGSFAVSFKNNKDFYLRNIEVKVERVTEQSTKISFKAHKGLGLRDNLAEERFVGELNQLFK